MYDSLGLYLWRLLAPLRGERGQDLAEYGLLIGLIALLAIVAVGFLGGQISRAYSFIC
jgi:Flp pilus assembly pilin Flp